MNSIGGPGTAAPAVSFCCWLQPATMLLVFRALLACFLLCLPLGSQAGREEQDSESSSKPGSVKAARADTQGPDYGGWLEEGLLQLEGADQEETGDAETAAATETHSQQEEAETDRETEAGRDMEEETEGETEADRDMEQETEGATTEADRDMDKETDSEPTTASSDGVLVSSLSASGASPRRLMEAAGAGLVLLAGGALVHEHMDSIKNGLQNLVHSIKNKPFSWTWFSWRLPRVNENDFAEFRVVADGLEGLSGGPLKPAGAAGGAGGEEIDGKRDGIIAAKEARGAYQTTRSAPPSRKRTFVHIIEKPSSELADFLGLGPDERENGFVLKGRSYREEFGREQSAWEVYVMQRHIPKHPLFFSMLKAYRSSQTGNIYLVLKRACCDLSQYYREAPRSIDIRIAAAEMAWSLSLLHKRGFLHRDVKPPNYFVSQEGHIQLGDFEMLWPVALPCPQEEATHTRGFTAPELRRFEAFAPFSIKTDVFALGMAYARLLMRVKKYQKVPDQNVFVRLILGMVDSVIQDRFDLDAVLRHDYFRDVDWKAIDAGNATPPPCPLAKQVMNRFAAARRRLHQHQQNHHQTHHQNKPQQEQHRKDEQKTNHKSSLTKEQTRQQQKQQEKQEERNQIDRKENQQPDSQQQQQQQQQQEQQQQEQQQQEQQQQQQQQQEDEHQQSKLEGGMKEKETSPTRDLTFDEYQQQLERLQQQLQSEQNPLSRQQQRQVEVQEKGDTEETEAKGKDQKQQEENKERQDPEKQ